MRFALIAVFSVFMVAIANAETNVAPHKKETASGPVDSMKAAANDIRQTAHSGAKAVKKSAKEAWRETRHAASEAWRAIKSEAQRVAHSVRDAFESSPGKAD